MPRAQLQDGEGNSSEWPSKALGRHQRRTQRAEASQCISWMAGQSSPSPSTTRATSGLCCPYAIGQSTPPFPPGLSEWLQQGLPTQEKPIDELQVESSLLLASLAAPEAGPPMVWVRDSARPDPRKPVVADSQAPSGVSHHRQMQSRLDTAPWRAIERKSGSATGISSLEGHSPENCARKKGLPASLTCLFGIQGKKPQLLGVWPMGASNSPLPPPADTPPSTAPFDQHSDVPRLRRGVSPPGFLCHTGKMVMTEDFDAPLTLS